MRAAQHFEYLHQAGLVHDPVTVAAVFIEMKTVEFLLLHHQLAVGAAGDLEGFTAVERQDLVTRRVLRKLQVPATTKTAVQRIERVIRQYQRNTGPAKIIGFYIGQTDRNRVLPGTWVNATLQKTHEVEGIGVHGS
ncbi:hypothetical protein D3C85_747870 [compost metagenome]